MEIINFENIHNTKANRINSTVVYKGWIQQSIFFILHVSLKVIRVNVYLSKQTHIILTGTAGWSQDKHFYV